MYGFNRISTYVFQIALFTVLRADRSLLAATLTLNIPGKISISPQAACPDE